MSNRNVWKRALQFFSCRLISPKDISKVEEDFNNMNILECKPSMKTIKRRTKSLNSVENYFNNCENEQPNWLQANRRASLEYRNYTLKYPQPEELKDWSGISDDSVSLSDDESC